MAVAIKNAGTVAETTTASIILPYPTVAAGDLLIAFVGGLMGANIAMSISATGWTTSTGVTGNYSGYPIAGIAWKIATGSESGSETFTISDNTQVVQGRILSFSGADTTNPFGGVTHETATGGITASSFTDSITGVGTDGLVVMFCGHSDDNTSTPDNGTEWIDDTTTSNVDCGIVVLYSTSTGSAQTLGSTFDAGAETWAAITVFISPPSTTGTLTQTLANATISATAKVDIKATSTQTLADLALSATGTVLIQTVLSQALEDLGFSAAATVDIAAVVTQTLEDAAIVATGEVVDRNIIEGTLSVTLDDVQITAYGTLLIQASVGVTLDDVQIVSRIFKWHWVSPDNDDIWTLAADDDDSWSDQADTDDSWVDQLDDNDTWTDKTSEEVTWH